MVTFMALAQFPNVSDDVPLRSEPEVRRDTRRPDPHLPKGGAADIANGGSSKQGRLQREFRRSLTGP